LRRDSVRLIHATLRVMLNAAIEDGLIVANPADRLGRHLRLAAPPKARQDEIKAFTREQASAFLAAAQAAPTAYERRYAPMLLLLARTGMRLGEAQAVQWDDVDFGGKEIRVERALSAGRIETPKSGHGRTVDMSDQLAKALLRLQVERKTETLKHGWAVMPPWVFCNEAGTPVDGSKVRKVFRRALKRAGLALHFTPHCLRHTFASLLFSRARALSTCSASWGTAASR
jgi:integrase